MPDVTPSGIISEPVANLRTLLSTCATFQTWTSTVSANAALAKIYEIEKPSDDVVRPFAVVDRGGEFEIEVIDAGNAYTTSGSLFLLLEGAIAEANRSGMRNAYFQFANDIGGILNELISEAIPGAPITLAGLSLVSIARASEEEQRAGIDYMQAIFELTF